MAAATPSSPSTSSVGSADTQTTTSMIPPPPLPSMAMEQAAMSGDGGGGVPPPVYFPPGDLPPPYHVAATLPTYEEAELIKAGKLDQSQIHREVIPGHIIGEEVPTDGMERGGRRGMRPATAAEMAAAATGTSHGGLRFTALTFPALDTPDTDEESGLAGGDRESAAAAQLLGNDFVFFTAFLTAFLFNWIGFLLLMCFCHTIAARYGALSGFGLSLAKWTLIVKNSTDFASASDNSWLWWLITAFGMLVCMRAIFQYLHIKRTWRHLSTAARERLFFFY